MRSDTLIKTVYYGFYILWFAWTVRTLVETPWMIATHAPQNYVGRSTVKSPTKHSPPVAKDLLFPQWESVQTYSVLVIMEIEGRGANMDKQLAYSLQQSPLLVKLKCFEHVSGAPLVQYAWSKMDRTSYTHRSANVATIVPRVSLSRPSDTRPPKCSLILDPTLPGPWDGIAFDVRWEIHITPHWHWTDWLPREALSVLPYLRRAAAWMVSIDPT